MANWEKWLGWLSAEPADKLIRPASQKELRKRSLVSIVNGNDSKVLARLHRGERLHIGASENVSSPYNGHSLYQIDLDLSEYFDHEDINELTKMRSMMSFHNDGRVGYSPLSCMQDHGASVVERTAAGVMPPSLYFNLTAISIDSYLAKSSFVNAGLHEPDPDTLESPTGGVFLQNKDVIRAGFNYDVHLETDLLKNRGRGPGYSLKVPAGSLDNDRIKAPELKIYIE